MCNIHSANAKMSINLHDVCNKKVEINVMKGNGSDLQRPAYNGATVCKHWLYIRTKSIKGILFTGLYNYPEKYVTSSFVSHFPLYSMSIMLFAFKRE